MDHGTILAAGWLWAHWMAAATTGYGIQWWMVLEWSPLKLVEKQI